MKYLIKKPDNFLNSLNNEINTILHRSFDSVFPEYIFQKDIEAFAMPVDIKEYDDKYCVCAEVPGIKKEDLNIEVHKNSLKITAKKFEESKKNNAKFHKTELRYGDFSRTIYCPDDIDISKATAELKHGILHLNLPKVEEKNKNVKTIEITE